MIVVKMPTSKSSINEFGSPDEFLAQLQAMGLFGRQAYTGARPASFPLQVLFIYVCRVVPIHACNWLLLFLVTLVSLLIQARSSVEPKQPFACMNTQASTRTFISRVFDLMSSSSFGVQVPQSQRVALLMVATQQAPSST
jgi:hypothetical protein